MIAYRTVRIMHGYPAKYEGRTGYAEQRKWYPADDGFVKKHVQSRPFSCVIHHILPDHIIKIKVCNR